MIIMNNQMSDFLKFAYEKGKVKELDEAFVEFNPKDEWHEGKIENVLNEDKHNYSTYSIGDIVFVKEYYYEALKKIGLVQKREEGIQYYFHNVSHYLGGETHDVGDRKGILQEGMVITVEPGLYIAPWRIGIRIEDDVLVTKDGAEVLTGAVVKDPDAIEALMAHKQS